MRPRHVWLVASSGMRQFFRDRAAVLWTFVFPVGMMVLMTYIFGGGAPGGGVFYYAASEDVLDGDGSLSDELLRGLEAGGVRVHRVPPEEAAAIEEYIVRDSSRTFRDPRAILVPRDFTEAVREGRQTAVSVLSDENDYASFTGYNVIAGVIADLYARHSPGGPESVEVPYRIDVRTMERQPDAVGGFYVPATVATVILFTSLTSGAATYGALRATGILRRVVLTPLTKTEWVLGVIVSTQIGVLLSAVLVIAVGLAFGRIQALPHPAALLPILVGTALLTPLGILLAQGFKEATRAIQVAPPLAVLVMFLSGYWFPVEFFPQALQQATRWLPTTLLGDGLRLSMTYGSGEAALLTAGILLLLLVPLLPVTVRLVTWGED